MSKLLVTGASGLMGRATIEHLLKKGVPAMQIVALTRDKDKVADLAAKGVKICLGDYLDYDSLVHAFKGVNKVMLTSAVAFSDRCKQHYNVITAARLAGVKQVVYMSIMRKEGSSRIMPEITESDIFTEQLLRSSGLDYTILYHPPFTDVLSIYYGEDAYKDGMKVAAGNGKMAPAMRDELAEAHAEILITPGHENKTYSLAGSELISFADIATVLSEIKKKDMQFSTITAQEYTKRLVEKGTPLKVAEFLTSWVVAIDEEEFAYQSGDLERLLGRKTKSFSEYVKLTLTGTIS